MSKKKYKYNSSVSLKKLNNERKLRHDKNIKFADIMSEDMRNAYTLDDIIKATNIEDIDIIDLLQEVINNDYNGIDPIIYKEKVLKKQMVNIFRHYNSDYEIGLIQMRRANIYSYQNYIIYKNMILKYILTNYPYLIEECNRQMNTKCMVNVINNNSRGL